MAVSSKSPFQQLAKEASMQPKEKLLAVKKGNNSLTIGIPKEITYQENRVPLTPGSVHTLTSNGHEVIIESNAGKAAFFTDSEYSEAGAKVAYNKKEVFNSDILLKVDPPTDEEIELMQPEQILISAIQMANLKEDYIRKLMKKKIHAVGYEFMKDESGTLQIIRSMSEIGGTASVLIAAEYLNNTNGGKGELIGGFPGIPPTQVVILGAGTVGESAARTALGLSASIKVFDNSISNLRRLQHSLGVPIYTSTIQPNVLAKALARADIAIGALRGEDGRSPSVVTEEMVKNMRPNSVIIDVSIDQGGCFETSEVTTHTNPVFKKYDVLHYCVPNIASRVSRTASYALSNIFTPILVDLADQGGFKDYVYANKGVRAGVYIYNGMLTNKPIGERFNMTPKDLDLILATQA